MTQTDPSMISDSLDEIGNVFGEPLPVTLSHELIGLLSEQMYGSPLKAIEELVVNAYDADAIECRISIPSGVNSLDFVAVYDNGAGMDVEGLVDLWHIGRSNKRQEHVQQMRKRKQIGKFGIGKLATYAIATRITYISKHVDTILAVTLDFDRFESSPSGQSSQITLPVYEIHDSTRAFSNNRLSEILASLQLGTDDLASEQSWTIVLLEDIKEGVNIPAGRLRWVLETAMPLKTDFELWLNGTLIESSKETTDVAVQFNVIDLPLRRIQALKESTGQEWIVVDDALVSDEFSSGVRGEVIVTNGVLRSGKSDDLMRSHGFFVKIRDRLVNEHDARFGLHELSYETFNRFRADIFADDLDASITAPREGVSDSPLKAALQRLLNELFNEARVRFTTLDDGTDTGRKEYTREYVSHALVEFPLADVLTLVGTQEGTDADNSWFYLCDVSQEQLRETVRELYSGVRGAKYKYSYSGFGTDGRMVRFFPEDFNFVLNEDHDIVRAYGTGIQARYLLEDIATGEAMLEIYLRETDMSSKAVGDILEKRDNLFRSLAKDHMTSAISISQSLLDAANQPDDLEIALVAAARAMGFVAKHLGAGDEPDGIAVLNDNPDGSKTITLEAKSSDNIPDIARFDFATLVKHVKDFEADGCMLVAPGFPGPTRGDDASIARLAKDNRVSCWTVQQLSDVVHATQSRHISARRILEIVLKLYTPDEVTNEIDRMLGDPSWSNQSLYYGILDAIEFLSERISDTRPTADMVLGHLATKSEYDGLTKEHVANGLNELAMASQGSMTFRKEQTVLHASVHEIRRRVSGLVGEPGLPRRRGLFRDPEAH